jgi:hypothetical protein
MSYTIEDDDTIGRIDALLPINEGILTSEERTELEGVNEPF